MIKRALTGILAAVMLFALLPAQAAQATIISGYTSKVDYDNTDPDRYKIDIDLVNQVITVYERGENGAYDTIVLQGLCTTGNDENPTGAGTYSLGHLKERFGYFVAFGQYAQYWTQVVRGIYIHSIMYDSKDITKISKSAYNGLGKALSHGCVRVLPQHAKWIFYNCPPGTTCVIARGRAANSALVSKLKAAKPTLADARHVVDFKQDPPIIAAMATAAGVPVRTGFSASKDKTIATLSAGEAVQVLQLGPDWCKVQPAKGKPGYVQTKYLYLNPDSMTAIHKSYVASSETQLYSYPSTNANQLGTFAKGSAVEVVGTVDKNWLSARIENTYGYVRIKHLAAGEAASAAAEMPALHALEQSAYVKDGIIANFRTGPGSSYAVIAELPAGTPLTLHEVNGNWYRATANGQEGYLSAVCVAFG